MVSRYSRMSRQLLRRSLLSAGTLLLLSLPSARPAFALTTNEVLLDAAALGQLEGRAAAAQPREQCILYAELLHELTETAGHQLAVGEAEEAHATFAHIDAVAQRLHEVSLRDAKRLKNAELLLQHISWRVSDMVKTVSGEDREKMQATLHHLESVHTDLLALVFSH